MRLRVTIRYCNVTDECHNDEPEVKGAALTAMSSSLIVSFKLQLVSNFNNLLP